MRHSVPAERLMRTFTSLIGASAIKSPDEARYVRAAITSRQELRKQEQSSLRNQWLEENRNSIKAYTSYVSANGVYSDDVRFCSASTTMLIAPRDRLHPSQ